jgi:hypothetical protein
MHINHELSQDHEDHEVLLLHLAQALAAKRPAAELRRCWVNFEENLFDHLDTEERTLFAVVEQAHRLELAQLRAEHRQIRQAVIGLSVSIELHTLRTEAIDELRTLLLAHHTHEERSLHRWIETDQGILARRGILATRARRERSSARMKVAKMVAG